MHVLAKTMAGLGLALAVTACVPVEAPDPGPAPGPVNQCGALDLQYLVGAPAAQLDTIRFNKPVRVIYPDTAVTMDYNPDRLNFQIDRTGLIARVTCG
ncbi:I78 family peptidase inhibitor [Paragemmobacter ruber]|uniref:Peptidase inhibitor I78 family protein n=1 Tax=Paragemmobacter ruber TaxID=1985673 RepID=A0ABW9YAS9_9RHOB|nr:I78 family peptidase inhibitor [Rhodobacter ruber]NBE09269.1 hypothetical protein [Rhodobacter ruber]